MSIYEHDVEMAFDMGRVLGLMEAGYSTDKIAKLIDKPESTVRKWIDIINKIRDSKTVK